MEHANVIRLFHPNGQATMTLEQRRLLKECEQLLVMVDIAALCLGAALQSDDVELCIESCRRLQSIGFLLGEQARLAS